MKIASFEDPFPRGKYMGPRRGSGCRAELSALANADLVSLTDATRFRRCQLCGGYIDILDLAWVQDREGPLPHPAQDRTQ